MKNYSILKFFLIPSLIILSGVLASCSSSPEVTRYLPVNDYNAAQEIAGTILDDMGYPNKVFKESTYYKYVLFDSNKKCTEGGEFCTCSDYTDEISSNDRCLKCGKTWSQHEEY